MAGSNRRDIIVTLGEAKLPSQVQKETGIMFCHVSTTLKTLVRRGLAQRISTSDGKRIYQWSHRGNDVADRIKTAH